MNGQNDLVYDAFERYAICIEDGHLTDEQACEVVMKQFGMVVLFQMKDKFIKYNTKRIIFS